MSSFLKKLVIIISVVIFILFISLLVAAWTMGMFSPVSVMEDKRGPYYAVILSHKGSYQGIGQKIAEVSIMLTENQIEHRVACGIYYDDPSIIAIEELVLALIKDPDPSKKKLQTLKREIAKKIKNIN